MMRSDLFDPPEAPKPPKPKSYDNEVMQAIHDATGGPPQAFPPLFDPAPEPRARSSDPATSHAAARSMLGDPCKDHRAAILGVLWRPMVASQIGRLTGLTMEQVCRRLPELEEMGLARPTGELGQSESGRACRLWKRVIVDAS